MTANTSIETMLNNLEDLRLPELWACFTQVVGKTTRAPNRKFLIRKIREAQDKPAGEPEKAPTILAGPLGAITVAKAPAKKTPPKTASKVPTEAQNESTETAPTPEKPAARKGPAKPAQSKASRAKKAPIRVAPPEVEVTDTPDAPAPEPGSEVTTEVPLTNLKQLSVDELRTAYLEEVGRGTKSTDRNYLVWKIRQARQGKVPVGPVTRTRSENAGTKRVLPLRMHEETIQALDEVWRRQGLKSRMDFFRAALDLYLAHHEEHDAAALVR